jgi:hypothetical protein
MGPLIRRQVIATKEITVNIHGVEYDALLIPKHDLLEIDYANFPEDDPLRREENIKKICSVDLREGFELELVDNQEKPRWRLLPQAVRRLLESL